MSEELKPCPFCGSKNIRLWETTSPWVQCEKCLSSTATGYIKEEAVENWNRRTNDETN